MRERISMEHIVQKNDLKDSVEAKEQSADEENGKDIIEKQTVESEVRKGIFRLIPKEYAFLKRMGVLSEIGKGESLQAYDVKPHIGLAVKATRDLPVLAKEEMAWLNEIEQKWGSMSNDKKWDMFNKRFPKDNRYAAKHGLALGIRPWYKDYDDGEKDEFSLHSIGEWKDACRIYGDAAKELQPTIDAMGERVDRADKEENLIFYHEGEFKTKEHEVLHKIMHEDKELASDLIDKVMDLYNNNGEAQDKLTEVYRYNERTKWEEFLVNTYIANKYGDEKTSYCWKADKLDSKLMEEIKTIIDKYLSS